MRVRRGLGAIAIGASVLFACSDVSDVATAPDGGSVAAAKGGMPGGGGGDGGGGSNDTSYPLTITWADGLEGAGIVGDGRTAEGEFGANESVYADSVCGVFAMIIGSTEDVNMDVDARPETFCGAARYLSFALPTGPVDLAPKSLIDDVLTLGIDEGRSQRQGFAIQQPDCDRIFFDEAYGSTSARITRVGEDEWTVESVDPHLAVCMVAGKKPGSLVASGDPFPLPFAFTFSR